MLLPEQQFMQVHALHVHDPSQLKDRKEVLKMLSSFQNETVAFLNDFDVPYVNIKKKFPRLKRKPRVRRAAVKDNDDDDASHSDRDDDDDDDDEDKDNDDNATKKSADDDNDDDDDDESISSKTKGGPKDTLT